MVTMTPTTQASPGTDARQPPPVEPTGRIETAMDRPTEQTVFEIQGLDLWYGDNHALKDLSLEVPKGRVTAFIGPSGCGKSSFLRCLNRMNDFIESARIEGDVRLGGLDIYGPDVDPVMLRRHVGMVFQKPNPFPKSIFDNVAYGLELDKRWDKDELYAEVKAALEAAHLWHEVEDRLDDPATGLSGGQQQRLCIARAIAVRPDVLLMDEPASALDPIATGKIEDLIVELKEDYTVAIVTHNMQQAARISDYTAFFYMGELVEFGQTEQIFESPRRDRTEAYITGRFG